MEPICVPCRRLMQVEQNSVVVHDPVADGFDSTYWMGDRWVCPSCQTRIILRARRPLPEMDNPPNDSLEFRYD